MKNELLSMGTLKTPNMLEFTQGLTDINPLVDILAVMGFVTVAAWALTALYGTFKNLDRGVGMGDSMFNGVIHPIRSARGKTRIRSL